MAKQLLIKKLFSSFNYVNHAYHMVKIIFPVVTLIDSQMHFPSRASAIDWLGCEGPKHRSNEEIRRSTRQQSE